MEVRKSQALLAASIAGLLAATVSSVFSQTVEAVSEGMEACYGVNACQGTSDCGGKASACAGKNACEGQGWLEVPEGTCLRIKSGRLTAEEGAEE